MYDLLLALECLPKMWSNMVRSQIPILMTFSFFAIWYCAPNGCGVPSSVADSICVVCSGSFWSLERRRLVLAWRQWSRRGGIDASGDGCSLAHGSPQMCGQVGSRPSVGIAGSGSAHRECKCSISFQFHMAERVASHHVWCMLCHLLKAAHLSQR